MFILASQQSQSKPLPFVACLYALILSLCTYPLQALHILCVFVLAEHTLRYNTLTQANAFFMNHLQDCNNKEPSESDDNLESNAQLLRYCLRCAKPTILGDRCCGWYAGMEPVTPTTVINGMDLKYTSWPTTSNPTAPYVLRVPKAEPTTSATIFGPSDMQISGDTSVKPIEGHFTSHFKAIVIKHK